MTRDDTKVIEFLTLDDKLMGRVTIKDGQMTGSNTFAQGMADSWKAAGGDGATFIQRYNGASNGYTKGQLVTE